MMNYLTPFERKGYDMFRTLENNFFDGFMPINKCKVDIRDTGDKYIMEAELPGFDKSELKLKVTGDTLTLTAEHKTNNDEKSEDGTYIRKERSYGKYQQSFDVSNVNLESIDAEYKNGILTLNMSKKIPTEPTSKEVEIK